MTERKYNLTLTEQQAGILCDALDLYARIGIGQFEEILHIFNFTKVAPEHRDTVEILLLSAKEEIGLPKNGSHGIHHPEVNDKFRAAFDLKQVVRNKVAWDRNPAGGIQVQFDTPNQTSEETPLATITSEPSK